MLRYVRDGGADVSDQREACVVVDGVRGGHTGQYVLADPSASKDTTPHNAKTHTITAATRVAHGARKCSIVSVVVPGARVVTQRARVGQRSDRLPLQQPPSRLSHSRAARGSTLR